MIIRIRRHPAHPATVILGCGADANALMGRFGPARLSPADHGYLLAEAAVPDLLRFLTHHDVTAIDERGEAPDESRPKFTGPLPECEACGQPASRQAAATLRVCPACGAPWRAAVLSAAHTPTVAVAGVCGACGRRQRGAFRYCGDCGAPMPAPAPAGSPPTGFERPVFERPAGDPMLFGEAIEAAGEDLERDHMQRAAGER